MNDIQKGFWIATNGGFVWRIYDIQTISDTVSKLYLEDIDNNNINLDGTSFICDGTYWVQFP